MRLSWLAFTATFLLGALRAEGAPTPTRPIVLVELFSSEGCSSCPPADVLLEKLTRSGGQDAVETVGLEWHVDYWNDLGWADPFSKASYSDRQRQYSTWLHRSDIYTPQMIVNGTAQFVGSNEAAARDAIRQAAAHPLDRINLEWTATGRVRVEAPALPAGTHLLAVVTESGLVTQVEHGENAGRSLVHGPVVRSVSEIDRSTQFAPELPPRSPKERLQVIVFAQDSSGRIVAAGAVRVKTES
jgi:hypothetical protein